MTIAYKERSEKIEQDKSLDYSTIAAKAASHLINEIGSDGYISAAKDYNWYKPHWFRDSSWVAVSLLEYYNFASEANRELASMALQAANKIIHFNIESIDHFIPNIEKFKRVDYEDPDFFNLKYHMPSRCGQDHEFFKSKIIDDTLERNVRHSWLMQYDSIPLILLSLQKKQDCVGLDRQEREFLDKRMDSMLEYLGKIYITECPSMWEINADMLHVYDVAAIYSAFKFAEKLAENHIIKMSREEVNNLETKYYGRGTLGFIRKYFVNGGMLYSEKKPFAELPELARGFDGSEILAFNYFGISSQSLNVESLEERTIKGIEDTLFEGNALPIRFHGDIYFTGGRWLLLGLEFASYYASNGKIEKAKEIVDYIESRYNGDYPEQEIVNPASPSIDQGNYYALNGYKPIQKLAWSYASMIMASLKLKKEEEKQKIV
ncbi:MAG: hypothetical protein ACP5NE_02185 [Candidatus Micrarchaeia archaeon]